MDSKDINFCCYLRTKDSDMVIYITKVLSQDIISRSRARDLMAYIVERELIDVILDFKDIKFATRSFIDEFYNLFLKDASSLPFKVEITNVPEDISVSKTQTKVKTIRPTSNVLNFENVDDLLKYMSTVAF